jgi:hypothetical protein
VTPAPWWATLIGCVAAWGLGVLCGALLILRTVSWHSAPQEDRADAD